MTESNDYLVSTLIAERGVIYRPSLRNVTKSVIGAILLNQIIYWWKIKEREKFYKFFSPCSHELYNQGDSWAEELGLSYAEIQTGLKSFAKKITRGISLNDMKEEYSVVYWTDKKRLTWYLFNPRTFELLYNSTISNYIVNEQSRIISPSEITTEIKEDSYNSDSPPEDWFEKQPQPKRDPPHSADEARDRITEAMARGARDQEQIRWQIQEHFRITPKWKHKDWSSLISYLKSRPEQEKVEVFAQWWYESDWRGKQGQAPTAKQIEELWLQAFIRKADEQRIPKFKRQEQLANGG